VRDFSAAMASAGCSTTSPTSSISARPGEGVPLKPGMFFTIEPMINLGKPHVKILSDGWTAVTRDRSLSAQFEHSVGVTEKRRGDFHAVRAPRREAARCGLKSHHVTWLSLPDRDE